MKFQFACELDITQKIYYGNVMDFGDGIKLFMLFDTINANVDMIFIIM